MTEAAATHAREPRARQGLARAPDLLADAVAHLNAQPARTLEMARAAAAAPKASQRVRCDAARAEGEALRRLAQWQDALAALQRSIDLAVALHDPLREVARRWAAA